MKHVSFIILLSSFFLLAGAGCFGGNTVARDGGVFQSVNAGKEWKQMTVFPSVKGIGNLGTVDVVTLAPDPSDPLTLYMGTSGDGAFVSYDAAATWGQLRDPILQNGRVGAIAVDPTMLCTVYLVKDQGMYRSKDCNRHFGRIYDESRPTVQPRAIAIDWYKPTTVYLGLSNGDLLKSQDQGDTWTKMLSAKQEITDVIVSQKDSRILLVATSGKGIFRTTDGGEKWDDTEETLKQFKKGDTVYDLVQDKKGDTVVAATDYGLLRSDDQGITWSAVHLVTSPGQVRIRALALQPDNAKVMYYTTATTFYKSIDGGTTWDTRKLPTTRMGTALQVQAQTPSTLYLGTTISEQKKKGL